MFAVKERPVNQGVSEILRGYAGVFLRAIGVKYISGYHGGARKKNVLAKEGEII